ncbi:tape measure protein [Stutzerimonas nitrititolerans]|uniref:tape measure protein n=1 Tax=Stutzerimonas nitrititolerans TaxID=2482751 RepID=UPI0028A89CBE|nr:tape measure protein [Stutzerimonas nitrititolerans]
MTEYARLVIAVDSTQAGKAGASLDRLGKTAKSADERVSGLKDTFRALAAPVASFLSVREVIRAADQYANLTNRLRLVTSTSEQLAYAQQAVMRSALETYQPLETTAEVYQRIAQNASKLGLSFAEVEAITKTVSRTIALSGADTQTAAGAMRQFGQALASGSLRGDELNSILEGTPALAQAIARGLGVSTGELRKMGAEGQLTASRIIQGLQQQEIQVEEMANTMNVTAGQAMVTFGNSLVGIVGKLDDASGASRGFASAVLDLSGAMNRFSSGEFMDFFRDSKQTAEGFNNEISVTLSKIRDLNDARSRLDKSDPDDTVLFGFKFWNKEELDAEISGLNGQIQRFQKARDRLIEIANKPGEDTPKDDSGGNLGGNGPNEESLRDAEKAAARLAALSKSTGDSLSRELALYGQSSEVARTHYEIVSGSLKGIAGQDADRLMDLARELDAKRDLTEQEQLRIDILRESGQLRAANDAQFQLEYAEKIAEYERQGNEEAVRRLDTLRMIREIQMNADQAGGTAEGVSVAPTVTGLDGAVGGASSEITRLNEEAEALAEWRAAELEKQREFLEARAINAEQFAEREQSINEKAREGLSKIETAKNQAIINSSADFFGNMAVLSQSGNKELGAIGKAAAIAQATMQGFVAVGNALAVPPYPVGLALAASAAVVTAANVASIAGVGFSAGGYTGDGGKFEPMGVVHGGEYVLRKEIVSQPGMLSYLDSLNSGKGYASGGFVGTAPLTTPAKAEGQNSGVTSVQIINNGEPMSARTEIDGATMTIILDRVQKEFTGSLQGDGAYHKAISGKYGLQTRGI